MVDEPRTAESCVEELYATHRARLVRAAVLLLGDRAAAEEVVQDAFVQLYRSWHRLRDPRSAAGYLHRTVVNMSRSQLRRRDVVRRHPATRPTDAPGADDAALDADRRAAVLAAVAKLAPRQRECIVLRWYLDMSEHDIAAALGISGGAVKTHLHRGLAALTDDLEELR